MVKLAITARHKDKEAAFNKQVWCRNIPGSGWLSRRTAAPLLGCTPGRGRHRQQVLLFMTKGQQTASYKCVRLAKICNQGGMPYLQVLCSQEDAPYGQQLQHTVGHRLQGSRQHSSFHSAKCQLLLVAVFLWSERSCLAQHFLRVTQPPRHTPLSLPGSGPAAARPGEVSPAAGETPQPPPPSS